MSPALSRECVLSDSVLQMESTVTLLYNDSIEHEHVTKRCDPIVTGQVTGG
jgi:hypothetical protein